MAQYRISDLAQRTGIPASTLRYYDQIGLLPAKRTPAGYRIYSEEAVTLVRFISRAKQLGLSLEDIREVVGAWDDGPCAVKARLRDRLAAKSTEVTDRIIDMAALNAELDRASAALREAIPTGAGDDTRGSAPTGLDPLVLGLPGPSDATPAESAPPTTPAAAHPNVTCVQNETDQDAHVDSLTALFGHATGYRLQDGAVHATFPTDPTVIAQVLELTARERLFCPFLTFTLDVTAAEVTLLVRPAGAEGGRMIARLFGSA
jgi:DNA-binding transcriptional MerR regulator